MDALVSLGPYLIPIVAIIGVFTYATFAAIAKADVRQLEIRERIAMIERGLVPPPEKDPAGFERSMYRYELHRRAGQAGARHRAAGITLIAVGLGLIVLLTFAGVGSVGIGVGGFVAILGMGCLVNSLFASRPPAPPPALPPSGAAPSGEPPSPPAAS